MLYHSVENSTKKKLFLEIKHGRKKTKTTTKQQNNNNENP